MTNKPTSKVIQIYDNGILTVLCEDGSIWRMGWGGDDLWTCILEPRREIAAVNTDE